MTKREVINKYFAMSDELNALDARLDALLKAERITGGARYYVYNHFRWYGSARIREMLNRAGRSKNYFQYIKHHTTAWDWNYAMKDIMENYEKALAFTTEQESLPFEQTQMQILKARGELK